MKTAMMNLIDTLIEQKHFIDPLTYGYVMNKAVGLLETEKNQMQEAHDHGYEIGGSPLMWDMKKTWTEFLKQNNLFTPPL